MPSKVRNFGFSIRSSLNNDEIYRTLYKPGQVPGTPASTPVNAAVILSLQCKIYLPFGNGPTDAESGRYFRLIQRLGTDDIEVAAMNFVASSSIYYYNFLSTLGAAGWLISPEVEIGFQQQNIGYELISGGVEKVDIFGSAVEDIDV